VDRSDPGNKPDSTIVKLTAKKRMWNYMSTERQVQDANGIGDIAVLPCSDMTESPPFDSITDEEMSAMVSHPDDLHCVEKLMLIGDSTQKMGHELVFMLEAVSSVA